MINRAQSASPLKSHLRRSLACIEPMEPRVLFTALPGGFSETVVADGLDNPTTFDVLPDGRVLISKQSGDLRVVENGILLPTPVLTLTVDSQGERGLLGVVHDPNFAANQFIYVYHTVPASGDAAPFNEVSRFTVVGDVADPLSRVDILQLNDLSDASNHNGGSMHFGNDGMLYIGVGENAKPSNAQTLSNLLGKVLRIDVSNIQPGDPINDVEKLIPTDNPFVNSATGINRAIFALGFRNPFTFSVNPITGEIFIDDVGQNTWEEIDKLVAGANYGWNHSEGFSATIPPSGLGPGVYHDPQLAYNHNGGPAGGGVAITGGTFYEPPAGAAEPFPASFNGKYFYQDLGQNYIRVFDPADPGSRAKPDTSSPFATDADQNPVDMAIAPDGGLYYLALGNGGQLLEIHFTGSALPTITQQPADQTATRGGTATFTAAASGSGTFTYQWQRFTAGRFVDIPGETSATLTLSKLPLSRNGSKFRVVVNSDSGEIESDAATLRVVRNHAPRATIAIVSGLRHGKFDAGSPIQFSLSARDPEDGAEPASQFTYQIDYITSLHSVHGGVVRPFVPATSGVGSGTFTPADSGPYTLTDVRYRITFTVTDAAGLQRTAVRTISPNTVAIRLKTHPAGQTLNVDGQPRRAPTVFSSVVGFTRLLDAPATIAGGNLTFSTWSDGGAASHSIVTPDTSKTYTAEYVEVGAS